NAQCRRSGLDAEVIIVEWNPPPERPLLKDVLTWPTELACRFRVMVVPPDVHLTLKFADMLPLFQMIAKNVGIRRAEGAFVLATNMDTFSADELIDFSAARGLEPGTLYRVNRHDIENLYPVEAALRAQMTYCRTHPLRIHRQSGSYQVAPDGAVMTHDVDI